MKLEIKIKNYYHGIDDFDVELFPYIQFAIHNPIGKSRYILIGWLFWALSIMWFKNDQLMKLIDKDTFIEKAATWIANRYQFNGSYLCADDIEDFEKYMRGE